MILFVILVCIILFSLILYHINKKLQHKFVKYFLSLLPIPLGIYFTYDAKVCTEPWCKFGSEIISTLLYSISVCILVICIVIDLIQLKNKKSKK